MKKTLFNFTELFIAKIKGDNAKVNEITARKNCISDLKLGIAKLEYNIISSTNQLTTAETALNDARLNYGNTTVCEMEYCNNLIKCQNNVQSCKNSIDTQEKQITFLKEELDNLLAL